MAGDMAIVESAARVTRHLPSGARLFRVGGDEFAVLSQEPVHALVSALTAATASTESGGLPFSAGVTPLGASVDAHEALKQADAALWFAKAQGRGRVEPHSPDTERFVADRRDMFDQMRFFQAEAGRWRDEASTDALTGIGNRRALDRLVELAERRTEAELWAVLFVDIDKFHDYNRRHGQAGGDLALRLVAQVLSSSIRAEDALTSGPASDAFRQGGEEFVAVAAVADRTEALLLAERLRSAVEALRLPHGAPGRPFVTVSIGVATAGPDLTVVQAVEVAARRAYWLKNNVRRNEVRAGDDE